MTRVLGIVFTATLAVGCSEPSVSPGMTREQLLGRLHAVTGVTVTEKPTTSTDYQYYVLQFTQPIDHGDPSRGTFKQEVSLLHRNTAADVPMIVQTSGYADSNLDQAVELTELLAANQVAIEHRYFGASTPIVASTPVDDSTPTPGDWSGLTIAQMAADEHEIITALRTIYDGAFLTTGGSKGGMTAVYHRRFYPDDVDGTVAYVAPISFGAPDHRYQGYLDGIGPIGCRQAVRDLATDILEVRRDAMVARAQQQAAYTYKKIELGAAVEASVVGLEWAFWQYHGISECSSVPLRSDDDDKVFAFLDKISPIHNEDDEQVLRYQPYFYQSYSQLGYPGDAAPYLAPYLHYTDVDYLNELPMPEPVYDTQAMRDIDDFVEHRGDHLMFIYGEWDPWTGGKFPLGDAVDSTILIQPQGTHSSWITNLEMSDREAAFAKLEAWTGVVPMASRVGHGSYIVGDLAPDAPLVRVHAPRAPK
jgi:PS-10 peptidase S37